jgi:DNA/RNA endonuclease YhcR with UshA esterase domain
MNWMKNILFIAALVLLVGKASAQTVIPAKEAAKHIGETVTITDKVYGGKLFSNTNMTLLDLGGTNPNQTLTIMIPGTDKAKFKGSPEVDYKGKDITVTGKIIDYKGKPEIIVTDPAQLKVVLTDNTVKIPITN